MSARILLTAHPMKSPILALSLAVALTSGAAAAPVPSAEQLKHFPKNLARHHVGTSLRQFDAATNTYVPSPAGAAWLDDDMATGAAVPAGRHQYLLSLAQVELLTDFGLSARAVPGTVSLFAGDEAAAPTQEKSWSVIGKDIPLAEVNEQLLSKPFSRAAKYFLLELNLEQATELYSLNLFGEKAAVSFRVAKREKSINAEKLLSGVNEKTAFSQASLYSKATVRENDSATDVLALQQAIDDNPETSVTLSGAQQSTGLVIHMPQPRSISRVTVKAAEPTKGHFDVYLLNGSSPANTLPQGKPVATIKMDGTALRATAEFQATAATELRLRWMPETAAQNVAVNEVEAFADTSLDQYAVTTEVEAIAEKYADASKDGKSVADPKDAKDAKEAVDAFDAVQSPTRGLRSMQEPVTGLIGLPQPTNTPGRFIVDQPLSQ